ncbi:DNA ligase IV [Crucibulum laeve]|uniref:DNA ligase n=1 Tax=Crucibulum laeve TaxID=68775 RepID=A0A5C3M539_9AGAR|nr:DNA ligase IV [Crucibulum laeve]
MQPTPAPSSPPKSPGPALEDTPSILAPPQNVSSAPFGILVSLFEKLQNERKQDRRRKLLDTWFNHWRDEKGYDLYPVLRLILPQKDRERAVYGLKEKNLAKTYIKLIPLEMKAPDAIRLLNWKKPTERDKTSGDFPTVLYEVVSKRSSVIEGSLSIDELNDILDELSKHIGKQDIQSKILQRVYNKTTAEEQRWIVRIILKDMIISVKETTVFSVFHPDAQDLYNTCSDLKKVAWELWDPSYRLNAADKAVQLFHAFTPMLCKRPTKKIEETVKEMGGSEFIIEEKLDGERMQLHKRGNEYFYCSRKGKDYTYLYGNHVGAGSLTPFIDSAFDPRVNDAIFDGEMLVYDPVTGRNLSFGTLKTAALDKSKKEHNPRPCFKVFDMLYLNGQSLLDRSTSFRKKNMLACLKPVQGRIEFVREYKGKTAKDIRTRMDEVMEDRGEGLVIKHPLSKYILNGRNMDWIKVKPEYMDNMGETVDVLVVGGNYGSGKRGGGVSTLVCAVMDDRRVGDEDEEPKYSTFVRIGSGLSFADYIWIRDKPWKVWDPKHPPEFLQTAKHSYDDKGDVYLEPADSFILKVKAAEITPSDQYQMGFTMRFPRALAIRDDLSIADCITATAVFESLRSEKKRKMETDTMASKKKRKVTTKRITVLPEYQGPKLKGVRVESDIFEGMTFVVMSDPKSRTGDQDKKNLMTMIHANGGKCAQIAKDQENLFVVYGGTVTPYDLKLLVDKNIYDVIKPSWVIDSVEAGELAPFRKRYFFHATPSRAGREEYDADQDDEVDQDQEMEEPETAEAGPSNASEDLEDVADTPKVEEEMDPAMADWFKIDKNTALLPDDSATEDDDSDNADVANLEDDSDLDDWLQVGSSGVEPPSIDGTQESNEDVQMGQKGAMEYDQEHIFTHLCFYLDSPHNAIANGMTVKSKHEKEINEGFSKISKMITENGGKLVGLDDPKLTHVIIDKRDESCRLDLIKRTSQPKRRRLVVSEYIEACLDEATLLDEDDFTP